MQNGRGWLRTALGQTEKNSLRANVFRVTLKADIAHCSRHVSKVPQPDLWISFLRGGPRRLYFSQPDFTHRVIRTLAEHDIGTRAGRQNVLTEIRAMMLTPQPVGHLTRVAWRQISVVVEI
jgi:hypothetical protein